MTKIQIATGVFSAVVGIGLWAATASAQVSGDAATATAAPVGSETGADTYMQLCAACHMPDAMGATGAGNYPALANNPRLMAGAYPLYMVVKGRNGMPVMGEMMTDQQVADVVNYVRTHFGNSYSDPVTAEQAAALR